jgi:uncharacterized RDD family membrane protein YckC
VQQSLNIRTPEGIVFAQTLATPAARFFAWLIDLACIIVLMIAVTVPISLMMVVSVDIAAALRTILYFVVSVGYAMTLEWFWRGQTYGKRLMRLRVVDAEGMRLEFSQVAVRNLLRVVDALPAFYLVGGVASLLSRKCQRLGDIAANTVVIRLPRLTQPDLEQLLADKFNSLRVYPHLAARLRQRVTPEEAAMLLQAIVRRDEFDPAARVQLFEQLASHLKKKVEFPEDASEGITDEQYVRNVVDIVYRTSARQPSTMETPT